MLPKALPHQKEVLRDPHRHKRVVCGRRWGKTGAGLPAVVKGHGDPNPASRQHLKGAIDGGNIWWVAPTFTVAKKIERDLRQAFRFSGYEYIKSECRIDLPGGGSITIKTAASPASLRGDGLDGITIDEAAFVEEAVWKEALRPALSDKQGWSLFLTTPNGLNWVKDQFDLAEVDPDFASWQLPSSQNPLMTPEELQSAKLDVGERAYSQEYLAQFVDTVGAEFSGYYFQFPDFWFDEWPHESDVYLRVLALDPSKGKSDKSDYSAFVLATLTNSGHVYLDADLERRDVTRIAAKAVEIGLAYRPHGMVVETNQFQELLAHLIRPLAAEAGLNFKVFEANNTANKTARIRSGLTPYLSRGELHFKRDSPGARMLVKQLQEFPTGDYDDGPDGLEMGIRLLAHILNGGAGKL
ncbi:terminase large subunit domain-containing protein [Blastopirellula retiformator]|uniref:Terminase-like family protein n=1 Tax=Blastopirellula retiformator TaxID=2527970 RepID=A0A5C5UZ02_9BACT|nr:terminase family protein [Blastopirellula retiformator]TWT30705.1 Terminase-like family protein [Blastopirellula retiformator]